MRSRPSVHRRSIAMRGFSGLTQERWRPSQSVDALRLRARDATGDIDDIERDRSGRRPGRGDSIGSGHRCRRATTPAATPGAAFTGTTGAPSRRRIGLVLGAGAILAIVAAATSMAADAPSRDAVPEARPSPSVGTIRLGAMPASSPGPLRRDTGSERSPSPRSAATTSRSGPPMAGAERSRSRARSS